ncbi:sugar phosphate isomerase/epimerase [Flaviflexus ciconiae]|uniref:Sugar phosphate isomerase/epimerase n=1 Tax=Flaviflexus ciconiae TaxID=2496867 RepID=A0A3Q9G5L4_9ACTO|nr:sugar phosphate isomerase/epimerase family protein [Flaviflexus ciconiae]AZQ77918.1 sugar phosphate isomerase/epimerase [Flaviflexus ciconiae]
MSNFEMACGINVYCSGADDPGLPAAMKDMGRLGYTHIAFGPMDPASTDIDALRTMMSDARIRPIVMAGLSPETDVSSEDENVRKNGLQHLRDTIDFAAALGADQLNGVSYALHGDTSSPYSDERFTASAETVGQAAEYAKSLGIKMTFEVVNRYETAMINTAAQAVEYVKRSGSDNLFIHLDTFHMGIEEADMPGAIKGAVKNLGYLELGQSSRASLNTGSVDIQAAVKAANEAGFDGRYGFEAFTRQLLDPSVGNALAIWRETYPDSSQIAAEAIELVRENVIV